MSSIHSPLVGPHMPVELKLTYLSKLPLSELGKVGLVSKEFLALSRSNFLWNPVLKQLNLPPVPDDPDYQNTELSQTIVLADLHKHQEKVDVILSLIDTDLKLASIIGCSSIPLIQLKKMLPIERSLHVMRGLRSDCTQLFVYLAKKPQLIMRNEERAKLNGFNFLSINDLFAPPPAVYDREDPCLPLLLEFINVPLGPFDAAMTMSAILPLARSLHAEGRVLTICASIIKSRQDLSDFFKTDILLENGAGEQLISVELLVREVLMPGMERYRLGVKMDDWIQCGFPE